MQDVNHQVSKVLVENNPRHMFFTLEALSRIRSATERVRRKDSYVSVSWSFYDLEQKPRYKAALNESAAMQAKPVLSSVTLRSLTVIRKRMSLSANVVVIHLMVTALEQ